jgi:OOP family OmpA-OmpF porin
LAETAAFGHDIRAAGHAAVCGIYFDTGKADIKPESAQAIGEIGKLLKADPERKVFVVGHTENAGSADGNVTLPDARAQVVMQALIRGHGIAPACLRATGFSMKNRAATSR